MDQQKRIETLRGLLQERVLVLDGATGTSIQARGLGPDDFGGPEYEGCNEHLIITRPDVIGGIHQSFLDAGADIVETNTFGATSVVLAEYDLAPEARQVNVEAARLARGLCDAFLNPPTSPALWPGPWGRPPSPSASPAA